MIELERVTVALAGRLVLNEVTITVEEGGWTTLIGANGAGKTTLLRAVTGALACAGSVAVAGRDPRRVPVQQRARDVAIVWQSPLLPLDMTVHEYVMLGRVSHLGMLGRPGAGDLRAATEAIRRLDLGALAARQLGALSGGERQRATLARALAQEAPVLILDEPTTALDVGRQQEALELVGQLREERRLTVLGAMHDLTLAGQYADRLALLGRGRLVRHGPPGEVLRRDLIRRHYRAHVEVTEAHGAPVVLPVRPGLGSVRSPGPSTASLRSASQSLENQGEVVL